MKTSFLLLGLLFLSFAGSASAQDKPLDCAKALDPTTPYGEIQIGCPRMANTPNNVAAAAINGVRWSGVNPTVKQCQIDLDSWKQEMMDWAEREKARAKKGPPYSIHDNPRPVELLSVEELYRRSNEADSCVRVLGDERERVWPAKDRKKLTFETNLSLETLALQLSEMRDREIDFLQEQLSRAESVVDKHLLWNDFITAR